MSYYNSGTVGGSALFSTWGKFRVTFARNARDVILSDFSIEYPTGLKAQGDGSGWIRKPPPDFGRSLGALDWQPCFFAGTYYPPPPEGGPEPDPVGEVVLIRGQQSLVPPVVALVVHHVVLWALVLYGLALGLEHGLSARVRVTKKDLANLVRPFLVLVVLA